MSLGLRCAGETDNAEAGFQKFFREGAGQISYHCAIKQWCDKFYAMEVQLHGVTLVQKMLHEMVDLPSVRLIGTVFSD